LKLRKVIKDLQFYPECNIDNKPISIQINVTNKCFQRCVGCRKYEWKKAELSKNTVKEIIEWLPHGSTVVFSGGDPTLWEPLIRVMADNYAWSNHHFGVLTSGLWPKGFPYRYLKMASSYIAFSIDGASRETYKKCRGVDTFHTVIENIIKLSKVEAARQGRLYTPRLRCNTTISTLNIHEMPDILKLCNDLGIESHFFPIHTWDDLKANHADVLQPVIETMKMESKVYTNVSHFFSMMQRSKPSLCVIPAVHLVVDANGDVFPCCRLLNDNGPDEREKYKEYILGNVHENWIGDIWKSRRARKIREKLYRPPCIQPCNECDRYQGVNQEWKTFKEDKPVFL